MVGGGKAVFLSPLSKRTGDGWSEVEWNGVGMEWVVVRSVQTRTR